MRAGVDYTHVLLTRFNLPTPGKEGAIRARPGWLAERFDLFEAHCLPSIAAQTERGFDWLIFFDEATPQPFRDRIEAARKAFPFVPVFTGHFGAEGWARLTRAHASGAAPWLATSRVDNDDGLAVDYIARVQAELAQVVPEPGRSFAINFDEGVILSRGRIYTDSHRSNAFNTRIEPFDDAALTSLGVQHMRLADQGAVRHLGAPPAWLQVVHGGNVSNKVRGRRVSPAAARDRFAPAALGALEDAGDGAIAFENAVLGPARRLRDAVLGLRQQILKRLRG